jgi:ABC-2 type transport system permease protein
MTTDTRDDQPRALRVGANPDAAALTHANVGQDAGMTAGMTLIARSLSRSWKPLLAVCLILMALQIVLVLNASAQWQAQTFSRMAEMVPAFLRRALGDLTLVMLSFQGVVCIGFFHPVFVLLVSLLGVYFGSEPAHDVESGYVDLLLARPLRRHWLVTRSLALVLASATVPLAVMALTMAAALTLFAPPGAPWPPALGVMKMAASLAAVASLLGIVSLLVASYARRRGTPIAVGGIIAMACYPLTLLEPSWRPLRAIGWLSPFHYFHPLEVLAGRQEPWPDLLILGIASAVLTALAYRQFARRDL